MKGVNTVGKMVLLDLLDSGLPQTFENAISERHNEDSGDRRVTEAVQSFQKSVSQCSHLFRTDCGSTSILSVFYFYFFQ